MKTSFFVSIAIAMSVMPVFGQNINNTLGASGIFTIKDGSTTFMSLYQSTGYLSLNKSLTLTATTDSSLGVIYKGTERFIHDFGSYGNTFVGKSAGNLSMTGTANTGIGLQALLSASTGSNNTAVGVGALFSNTTASWNTSVGSSSLSFNTEGSANSAFGHFALRVNTTGSSNAAFGKNALMANTTGPYNSAFGYASLATNITGRDNVALGYSSLFNAVGDSNSALGYYAGSSLTSGSNNTVIGHYAQASSATVHNEITLGNLAVTTLRCNATTITSLSDARDKRNIRDLPLGLEFLMTVKPRLFNWDRREWYENGEADGSKMQKAPAAGFIAQELDNTQKKADAGWLNLVLESNPDRLEATPGNLLPVMVKAIQELKALNDQKDEQINTLNTRIAKLEALIEAIDRTLANK